MEKNNGISDSRYKSRFFKKLAAWMGKHGAALTAVVLIAVSAILGCAEATIIYAAKGNEASNDYGTRGNTSSPSYIGGVAITQPFTSPASSGYRWLHTT